MTMSEIQRKSLPSRSFRWSWALVVACGLVLGYYVVQTYFSPKVREYQLNFGNAQWIEPPEVAPIAYFRKEVFLSHTPARAWLEVAGTDNFELIINSHTIGRGDSLKSKVAGVYDIKKALKVGTNVIAVSISRTSFPGSAQLLACGVITKLDGNSISVISDESWRVTPNTGIVEGSEEWTSPKVEQDLWPNARRSFTSEKPPPIDWVDTNPLLFQLPLIGSWIMAEDARSEIVCSTTIEADAAQQETWIQVATTGDLDLLVNGHLVTLADTSATMRRRLPHLPSAQPTPAVNERSQLLLGAGVTPARAKSTAPLEKAELAAYEISYWIKKGPNAIVAAVRNDQAPARFFADGFLVGNNGTVSRFGSDSHWQRGDQPSTASAPARARLVEVGKDGSPPWGYLPQEMARPAERTGLATVARSWGIILLTTLSVLTLWLLVSALVAGRSRRPLASVMIRDALLHGPVVVGLLLLLLPNFDPRFPDGWSFQPFFVVCAVLALLAVRLLHLIAESWAAVRLETAWARVRQAEFRVLLPYLLLALIIGLGFGLRYHNLSYMSFDHDEMGLVVKSKGVLKLGFPYTTFAGVPRPLTTYELVPYPLALSGFLFGYSEWSMRLPACLMGTFCIGVLALIGRRLFNWRAGLFAAFIYACFPLNIRWAQNAFYLTQCQLMTMLTIWLFYEAFRFRPLRRGFLTATTVAFCVTYLSWEGSGFLLPALFMGLLVIRWGEWWWIKEFHLYRCLFFIGAVVVAQYCSRTIFGIPYLQVGSGLSNLTGPSLFFLTPAYQPRFYIDQLLLAENHVFFTVMILLGLPFCWSHRGFRYICTLLTTLWILHTNFLAALSPRYCYYFQPLVVLGGTAATILLYDRLVSLARHTGDAAVSRLAAHATGVAAMILLFLQSNEWLLNEYKLSSRGNVPGLMTRLNTYRYDYRGAAQFVMSHIQPGDLILPGIPHVFEYYAGRPGDYFLDTLLGSKVPYNEKLVEPRFVDKFGGLPAIRNLTELLEVTHRARRTWVVFAPYSSFHKLNAANVLDYLDTNAKIEFESYRAKVLLVQGARQPTSVAASP
jgi:hypothetical protein